MPFKNIYVVWMIYKELNRRIFRVFSVVFVYFSASTEKS